VHDRPLSSAASSPPLDTASAPLVASQAIVGSSQINEMEPASTACSLPGPCAPEADLTQKLICLETQVVTLQEQLTQLAAFVAAGTGAIGRGSAHGPGVPHTTTGGKADARAASYRG
jgi:hypothetical protein